MVNFILGIDVVLSIAVVAGLFFVYSNRRFATYYKKKWVFVVAVGFSLFCVYQATSFAASDSPKESAHKHKKPEADRLKETIHADKDSIFKSTDGYEILIPAGYTYSASTDARVSLRAMKDAETTGTPVFVVTVMEPGIGIAELIDQTTKVQRQRNATTKFGGIKEIRNGNTLIYKLAYSSVREKGPVKGYLVFSTKSKKVFMVTIVTTEELFSTNSEVIDRVIESFRN